MKKITTLFLLLLSAITAFGQSRQEIDMADAMRKNGKIWVVVATIAISFAGLAIYLIRIDRKLKRMERVQNDNEQHKSINYKIKVL
ncbi:CcmD family protein [Mucilaginibacter sabulilitoris]|uniref:CcmD family protein n=1 Tax=Mucilaginibacter sabulilitoris TaxID=1173583 RepID=A0ABZ0TFI7_9SPHI|nr:CcmD family protein [Mucilaginibacter sabulilitoris]WPU91737.1 CcmD family protein [Mucilaginibacter sabulilitoris]